MPATARVESYRELYSTVLSVSSGLLEGVGRLATSYTAGTSALVLTAPWVISTASAYRTDAGLRAKGEKLASGAS